MGRNAPCRPHRSATSQSQRLLEQREGVLVIGGAGFGDQMAEAGQIHRGLIDGEPVAAGLPGNAHLAGTGEGLA